jgi:hypothetical protein
MATFDMVLLDDKMRLEGDEDCGVGIHCRTCNTGGAPIAYYAGLNQPYPTTTEPDTTPVDTITALLEAGEAHASQHHAA